MQYYFEEFIDQTNTAKTQDEVFALFKAALINFGFDRLIYTFITDFPAINQKAGHGIISNYPEDWMKYYGEKEYQKIDPVTIQVLRNDMPFTWDCLGKLKYFNKKQLQILAEGNEAGLHDGMAVPLYGTNGGLAGVGVASSSEEVKPDRNRLSAVKLLTEQFHLAYCSVDTKKPEQDDAKYSLSNRESEILKLWSIGKSTDEISILLNCKPDTIKYHVKNIYNKLEANSKILAVTKAIRLGIIPLDVVKI